jgi:hypothetical protein
LRETKKAFAIAPVDFKKVAEYPIKDEANTSPEGI